MKIYNDINKKDVEALLGFEILHIHFQDALIRAKRKQMIAYERERRIEIMQPEYLIKLTAETFKNSAFSKLTIESSIELRNMEKEHLTHSCTGAPTDIHIVSAPAL